MFSLLTLSLLPALLLSQPDDFDDELLLHPDLEEDGAIGRQSNSSSSAATTSLLFGVGAILLLTSNATKFRINLYQN